MNIDDFIDKIETEFLDSALEQISQNPKDLISVYLNALEYQRAKLVRSTAMLNQNQDDKIKIEIVTQSDTDISESPQSK